jgi:LysM repeat protein
MRISRLLIALLVLSMLAISLPTMPAAAAPTCRAIHSVKEGDTLNKISEKYNIDLNYLVKSNNIYKDAPSKNQRRSIYVYQRICIESGAPAWNGKKPTWGDWPASNYTARLVNGKLEIHTTWFNYPTAYYVKIGSTKIGLLSVKFHNSTTTFPLTASQRKAPTVCLKNLTTDANICRPILK